ncbi:pentapeptide repeat-containing protein [Candidatus Poriferisodalis sp.]|uniref:pentapeptide repeat-containing protein n=1 Tax=Candidatus Poriferisodalis sp. TaxID=3101277 RepID=UPI003B01C2AE
MSGSVLSGSVLSGSVLSVSVLSGSVLSGSVLSGSVLSGSVLSGSVLSGSVLSVSVLSVSVLSGSVLSGSVLPLSSASAASLRSASACSRLRSSSATCSLVLVSRGLPHRSCSVGGSWLWLTFWVQHWLPANGSYAQYCLVWVCAAAGCASGTTASTVANVSSASSAVVSLLGMVVPSYRETRCFLPEPPRQPIGRNHEAWLPRIGWRGPRGHAVIQASATLARFADACKRGCSVWGGGPCSRRRGLGAGS